MSLGVITLIASVVTVLGAFLWQPWQDDVSGGGIQGGADPTPVPGAPP